MYTSDPSSQFYSLQYESSTYLGGWYGVGRLISGRLSYRKVSRCPFDNHSIIIKTTILFLYYTLHCTQANILNASCKINMLQNINDLVLSNFCCSFKQNCLQARPINFYKVGGNPKKSYFLCFRALWAKIGWGNRL